MATQLSCDICGEEPAAQMLTNLQTGDTMTLGLQCTILFYGSSLLTMIGSDGHHGPAGKCQACRRIHERMTVPVAPAEPAPPADPATAETSAADD